MQFHFLLKSSSEKYLKCIQVHKLSEEIYSKTMIESENDIAHCSNSKLHFNELHLNISLFILSSSYHSFCEGHLSLTSLKSD